MLWLAFVPSRRPPNPASAWSEALLDWRALACWAGRYTPRVSLTSGVLWCEISASLRLFGGVDALLERIRADLAALGMPLTLAVAATPRAALWLASAERSVICHDLNATRATLRGVPLQALALPPALMQRLTGFGLREVGQLMDLPRAALGARTGKALLLDLARALGEVDECLPWFQFPERYAQRIELPAPVEAAPVLLFAARRLVAPLAGWLTARNAALREMLWQIGHGKGDLTRLPLRFSRPVHGPVRIERVLKEALDRLNLPRPALELGIEVEHIEQRDARTDTLFDRAGADGGEGLAELLDRLTARLGEEAVYRVRCHADHRPEMATLRTAEFALARQGRQGKRTISAAQPDFATAGKGVAFSGGARPLWLYDPPRVLRERGGRPCSPDDATPLSLLAGPERIESGWWDGTDVRRDYFIALDARQRWLWIYRSMRPVPGWFLQGVMA